MSETTSVLMAEAAAMAFAASVLSTMDIQSPIFLTDNQQLATFFNADDHSSPPQWDIKNITQKFVNFSASNNCSLQDSQASKHHSASTSQSSLPFFIYVFNS